MLGKFKRCQGNFPLPSPNATNIVFFDFSFAEQNYSRINCAWEKVDSKHVIQFHETTIVLFDGILMHLDTSKLSTIALCIKQLIDHLVEIIDLIFMIRKAIRFQCLQIHSFKLKTKLHVMQYVCNEDALKSCVQ